MAGSFDQEIRQQMRGMNSQRGGDNQQAARDAVARRRNIKERGVNSTAYKEKPAAKAKSKSSGGGKKAPGKGPRKSKPGAPPSTFKPDLGKRPDQLVGPTDLPQVGAPDPMMYLLPLLLSQLAARKGGQVAPSIGTGRGVPQEEVPVGAAPPAEALPPTEDAPGRFLTESEIGDMRTKMPGVINSPGWGPQKVNIPEFDPNIHVPRVRP